MKFKACYFLVILLMLPLIVVKSQSSLTIKTKSDIVTGDRNRMVKSTDAYYIAKNAAYSVAGDIYRDVLFSKFDECFEEIWTVSYHTSTNVTIVDLEIFNEYIILQFLRSVLIVDFDGNIIDYLVLETSIDTRFYQIQVNDERILLFASSLGLSRPTTIELDENFQIVQYTSESISNDDFFSGGNLKAGLFNNGDALVCKGNVLISYDKNFDVRRSKFYDIDFPGFLEVKPKTYKNDLLLGMKKNGLSFICRIDSDGKIIWNSESLDIYFFSSNMDITNDTISLTYMSAETYSIGITKFNAESGELYNSTTVKGVEDISFPVSIKSIDSQDLVISASHRIDFANSIWEDFLLVNPQKAKCYESQEQVSFITPSISITEISNFTAEEPLQLSLIRDTIDIFLLEDDIYTDVCIDTLTTHLDTSYNCDVPFDFIGDEDIEYFWSDGDTEPTRSFMKDTDISVYNRSCGYVEEIHLNIEEAECPCEIYSPNIFSPSSHQYSNTIFGISSNCQFMDYSLEIFDRWGNLLFAGSSPEDKWVGDFNGKAVDNGVYVYYLKYKLPQHTRLQSEIGTLTLIN